MILYYALGGGLGHLCRARAVLFTLGLDAQATILSSSPHALDARVTGGLPVITVPPWLASDRGGLQRFVLAAIRQVRAEAVFIDAFPCGILGELCDLPWPGGPDLCHVARLLRLDRYAARISGAAPRFSRTYLAEPPLADQAAYLDACSARMIDLPLRDPPGEAAPLPGGNDRPLWLIVHSDAREAGELCAYAREMAAAERARPRLVLAAPTPPPALPEGVEHADHYPAWPLFPACDRIISACGFNIMRQAAPFRHCHRFIPLPRALDDQFVRAARARQASSPTQAGS